MIERLIIILKYIVLGVVQGVSEMLPISSSGHLLIIEEVFNVSDSSLSFEVFLHLASLLALLYYYFQELGKQKICINKIGKQAVIKYMFFIIISSIPAGVLGLLFKDKIEELFSDIKYVGVGLTITSIILLCINYTKKKHGDLNYKRAFFIGLFQMIGIVPGISRSGVTYLGGKINNVNHKSNTMYTFLLLVPVTMGSLLLTINDFKNVAFQSSLIIPYIISFIITFVFTIISLKLFNSVMNSKRILYFSLYCFVVGFLVIIL